MIFMNTLVGFTFTETPIQRLKNAGFSIYQNDETLKYGYREFLCPFQDALNLEFREIIDENAYFDFQKKRDLSPFETTNTKIISDVRHDNSVMAFGAFFGAELPDGELKDYLKIRKTHSIWLAWLKCGDFSRFKNLAKPDHLFDFKGQPAALIHLGQSCFDILVTV